MARNLVFKRALPAALFAGLLLGGCDNPPEADEPLTRDGEEAAADPVDEAELEALERQRARIEAEAAALTNSELE